MKEEIEREIDKMFKVGNMQFGGLSNGKLNKEAIKQLISKVIDVIVPKTYFTEYTLTLPDVPHKYMRVEKQTPKELLDQIKANKEKVGL